MESLYSRRSNLVIGFHGCDLSVAQNVVAGKESLVPNKNGYDWLGNGIYLWENNEERARQWAKEMVKRKNSPVKNPAVLGAVIDLGYCFDLTDSSYLKELKQAYKALVSMFKKSGTSLPKNTTIGNSEDLLIRKLDCAVIQTAKILNIDAHNRDYDSVKGVFWEGKRLYRNAGFREKNHIQICICNPNCIKGYFLPKKINSKYINP